ncbi:UNVERIFIED_CONTAM: hypothetical protein PYX00_003268 [Menopon gallinae]|uniref:Ribosomal RNA-processing protein 14/surfeit locus protein 6 C-terminal domain-containing protein n=1 Tax=Menopon gallinae TaxID=328185 RepID=A0AAW2HZM5_9NEOP
MRIAALKGRTKLSYKEKACKKNLKNRLKKKDKKERRKQARSANKAIAAFERKKARKEAKPPKPVYDKGQMIFSKFDFSETGVKKAPYKNPTKDPEVALKKIKEEDKKLKTLKEEGETELVQKIVEKKAWKTAFMKSEGVNIKDDPELLKKAIRKKKSMKDRSIKKWEEREHRLNKFKEEKQRKRMENIQARAENKKQNQMKKAAKRGRVGKITAGF